MILLRAVEGARVLFWDKFGRPPIDAEFPNSFPEAGGMTKLKQRVSGWPTKGKELSHSDE